MDTLIDVFLRCSNGVFVNNLRNTRDFHRSTIDTPEKLFSHVQSYYNDLLIKPNGWIRAKNKSAFLAELPELAAMADFPQESKPKEDKSSSTTNSSNGGGNDSVERDAKGRIIDRNPPKAGESTKREKDGRTEYWCGKCPKGGRWGNHDDGRHEQFLEKSRKWREAQKKKREEARAASEGAATEANTSTPPSMHGANVCRPVLSWFSSPSAILDDDASF